MRFLIVLIIALMGSHSAFAFASHPMSDPSSNPPPSNPSPSPPPVVSTPVDCGSWSSTEWTQYESALSSRIDETDDPCTLTDDLSITGKSCAAHFPTPINFVRYCNRPTMDPDQFLAQQDHPALQPPPEFETSEIDDWKNYKDKYPYVEFDSNLGNHRVIFLDSHSTYDRWILFFNSILDVIVLDKSNSDCPQVYFREFFRGTTWYQRGPGAEACYGCHISGLRQIVPKVVSDSYSATNVQPFNERMKSYGVAGYHGTLKREDYGPSIGGNLPTKYSCANCHDGQTRGILNELDEPGQYTIKVIIDKTMPLNHPELSDDQRSQMLEDMQTSYPQELKKWLEQF